MKKAAIIWIVIAIVLTVAGAAIAVSAIASVNWDFSKLSTETVETNVYTPEGDFDRILIDADTTDVVFAKSDDGKCRVECREYKNTANSVTVEDGTLKIKYSDERKWYEHIGLWFDSEKVTVFLPKDSYDALTVKMTTGNVKIPGDFRFACADIKLTTGNVRFSSCTDNELTIRTSTGDIVCENASVGDLFITVTTGNVKLSDVKCVNFTSEGDTGDIRLDNVIVEKKLSINRSTGNVRIYGSDAEEIFVRTSTGNVSGKLLTDKIYEADTSTGDVRVPNTHTGGRCEIRTSTGNIRFE